MARIRFSEDLTPISDFRVHTAEIVAKVKKTKRPVILTQCGRPEAVLEDIQVYERRTERIELLEAVLSGIRAAEKGTVISHTRAMVELDRLLNA